MDLISGRRRYVGYAVLAAAGLWNLGVVPHAPRLRLPDGKPTWARLRNPHTRATPLESRLGAVASTIAGRDVAVRCDDLSGFRESVEPGGVVQFSGDTPANYTRIRWDVCTLLARVAADRGAGGPAEAQAVEVLAHESFHLRGVKDEAAAECYALQLVAKTARRLGATAANAELLHEEALRDYPRHPREYLSPRCRPGGALDLHRRLPGDAAASY
jgi:hypothetical protein